MGALGWARVNVACVQDGFDPASDSLLERPDQNVNMDATGQMFTFAWKVWKHFTACWTTAHQTQINIPGENWISDIFSGGSDVSLMMSSPVNAFNNAQLTEKKNVQISYQVK